MPQSLRLLWLQCYVFVIVLLQCNIFSRSVGGDRCFHEKVGGRFVFDVYTGASSANVGFHDVLGAVGLISERVVCVRATGTC